MTKDVDPREWLVCRIQEQGSRYLILIYEYISLYSGEEEEWERLAQSVRESLDWAEQLTRKE